MQEYKKRVIDEKNELDKKISNMKSFVGSITYNELQKEERDRLENQLDVMIQYSYILGERIDNF